MKVADILISLLVLILFLSPFLIGYGIDSLMNPSSFIEKFITLIIIFIVCLPEGFIAWIIGFAILSDM